MTLIDALETLKAAGTTKITGYGEDGLTNIDDVIGHAKDVHETAAKYASIECNKYALEHEDDHFIIDTADGHHIIAEHYSTYDMPIYSDYSSAEEADAAFRKWQIAQQAAKIANEKAGQDSREAWKAVATAELRAAYRAADEAFEHKYGKKEAARRSPAFVREARGQWIKRLRNQAKRIITRTVPKPPKGITRFQATTPKHSKS